MKRMPLLLAIVVLGVLLTACSTQVTGMQAPVGHDYDTLQWRPLDGLILQPLLVAPGYTAVLENDVSTTPAEMISRLQRLPADVRNSQLTRIQVRVRQAERQEGPSAARIQIFKAEFANDGDSLILAGQSPIADQLLTDVMDDDERASVGDLPRLDAGQILVLQIIPDEERPEQWEFALTPGRQPYGGWPASRAPLDANNQFNGAVAFKTIFEQDPNVRSIAEAGADEFTTILTGDPFFSALYGLLLFGTIAGGLILLRQATGSE